jgi:signal transduction histidine kinase
MEYIKDLLSVSKDVSLLFVDDDLQFSENFQKLLATFFENITIAHDGLEGLACYKNNHYDLIISDIQMPHLDGIAMCRQIKDENPNQLIIISSAHDDTHYLFDLINLGIDAFFVKPIQTESMLRTLYKLCSIIQDKKDLRQLNKNLQKQVDEEIQKRQESELLLTHQSRMAEMGQMLTLIAHQWKQPLTSLNLLAYDLVDANHHNELTPEYLNGFLQNSTKQINFLHDTTKAFQDFLAPNRTQDRFNIKIAVIESIHLLICSMIKDGIILNVKFEEQFLILQDTENLFCYNLDSFKNHFDFESGYCYGFVNEFKQVIVNILKNASDALIENQGGDKNIDITTTRKEKTVEIKISDNGQAISTAVQDQMFDSFFTTKKDSGTGIGLYLVKLVVEKHMNGEITFIQNKYEKSFIITLPLA